MNRIYLRRRNKIIINKGMSSTPNIREVATLLKNVESLGYTFSEDIIKILYTYTIEQLKNFYKGIIKNIKKMAGADVIYSPMYPNFPAQVMKASECELYINAIIHYLSFGSLVPYCEMEKRKPLKEKADLQIINLGNQNDFNEIFINIIGSKTSISDTDKMDLKWFIKMHKEDIYNHLPEEIPLKENACLVCKLLYVNSLADGKVFLKYLKTATDVLRFATALSDSDISLATNPRFISFKRNDRRLVLSLLENCQNIEEDMLRYKNQWIRLGEFARKLDHTLRICDDYDMVLDEFYKISGEIATPVLLQVYEHFRSRNEKTELRVFFPKGSMAKVYGLSNNLPDLDQELCQKVVEICKTRLKALYGFREKLGKVYIDEELKDYIVPFSQRSASKALKTIARGSRIDILETATAIRTFIYWKEPQGNRTDIDLSAVMYDENWNYKEHISYTNLRSIRYKAAHSGDITSAPKGASEFIDLDLESVRNYGGRYVVFSVNSFTGQHFVDLPECFMGWMARKDVNSGEIYEAKTVKNKIDITSQSTICIPMVLDLYHSKVIWADISLKSQPIWNNVENNMKGMILMGKALTTMKRPNWSVHNLIDTKKPFIMAI
jgi:stress response protein SCP2